MMSSFVALVMLVAPAQEAAPAPAPSAPAAAPQGTPPADGTATAPATETPAADPAATPASEPAPAPAPEADASVPRANDAPITETTPEMKIGKIVSGVVLASGAVLVAVGVVGLGGAALLASPLLKDQISPTENPRRTAGTIFSAIAAGGLMLGLTCVLGGLFGVFVG